MDFTNLTPYRIEHFGGQCDFDDPTQIPKGLAIICQNSKFSAEGVGTRFGTQTTILGADGASGDAVSFDVLNTLGVTQNQDCLVYGSNGKLYIESPPGSGTLVPVVVPFLLPQNSYMLDTLANNQMYMSFSDFKSSTIPPFFFDGRTGDFDTIGQVPIGAAWKQGTYYKTGDLFKSIDGRWWRNLQSSGIPASGNVPQVPSENGFFSQQSNSGLIGTVSWVNGVTTATLKPPLGGGGIVFGGVLTTGFHVGDSITVAGCSLPFYNGVFTLVAVGPVTLQWLQAPPPPAISANVTTYTFVANASPATDGVTTAVITGQVGVFNIGDSVVVSGAHDNFFNGTFILTAVTSTSLQWTQQQPTLSGNGPVSIPIAVVELIAASPFPTLRITLNQTVPFFIGSDVSFSGLTTFTLLNGVTSVITGIPSSNQFECANFAVRFVPATYGPASDTGNATAETKTSTGFSTGGTVSEASTSVAQGTGGTVVGNAATLIWNPATAVDDGGAVWEEWTPNVSNQLLAPTQLIGSRQSGLGSLPGFKDIYVKTTYVIPGTGETPRSLPLVLAGSVQNDQILLRAPRMPRWMAEVNIQSQRFSRFFLNVYVASVAAGATPPADSTYKQYATLQSVGSNAIVINTVPGSDIQLYPLGAYLQVLTPNAPPVFIGEAGRRNMIVVRLDKNGSPSPVDSDSVIAVDIQGQISANIVGPNLSTRSGGIVEFWVDDISKFYVGQTVIASGLADTSFDGTYIISLLGPAAPTYPSPGGFLQAPTADMSGASSSGGTVQSIAPPPPVAFLPPGGNSDLQDILGLTLVGTGKAGPFSYIAQANPTKLVTTNITALKSDGISASVTIADGTGFEAGQTALVAGFTGSQVYLNGVVQIGSVSGSSVSYLQGGTPATLANTVGVTITVLNVLPMCAPASIQTIVNVIRDSAGNVTASVPDTGGFAAGQIIQAASVQDATFNGIFQITSVQTNDDGFSGALGWTQAGIAATSMSGTVSSISDFVLNFQDEDLKGTITGDGTNLTDQLTSIPPPPCVDIAYLDSLRRVVYTKGNDTAHYFSTTDDPANIQNSDGILGINSSNGKRTIAIREMLNGEIISLKEDGGYAIEPSDVSPSQWTPTKRWGKHAPAGPRAIALGPDWMLIFSPKTGPWRYYQGQLTRVGRELTGTWKRVNWKAKQEIWIEVDENQQKAYIGLPLDGSTTCNYRAVLDYFNGWDDPISLYRGQRYVNPLSRRWSVEPFAARYGKIVDRTLATSVNELIDDQQMLFGMAGNSPLRIRMEVPDLYNDDGLGIDWQYQPAYAEDDELTMCRWLGISGRSIGRGGMIFSAVALQDKDQPLQKASKQLVLRGTDDGFTLPSPYQGGEDVTTDLFTYLISNGAVADAWGELQELFFWYTSVYPARKNENLLKSDVVITPAATGGSSSTGSGSGSGGSGGGGGVGPQGPPGPAGATGATGPPGPQGATGSGLQTASVTFSTADLLVASATPKTLVPAQGPNKIILGVHLIAEYFFGGTPFSNLSPGTFWMSFNNNWPNALAGPAFQPVGLLDQSSNEMIEQTFGGFNIPGSLALFLNQPLTCQYVTSGGNPTLGNGSMKVTISYEVFDLS